MKLSRLINTAYNVADLLAWVLTHFTQAIVFQTDWGSGVLSTTPSSLVWFKKDFLEK